MARRTLFCWLLLVSVAWPAAARAQSVRTGRLLVTVVDPLGGVIPAATVSVTGNEDATRRAAVAPVKTNERGIATLEALALGRYTVTAEFTGFETGVLKDVRVRAGDNRQTVALALRRLEDAVTVGGDRQESASDRALAFGTALTREQVELLSEDSTEMRNQLLAMAGDPNAVIKVDSFEGQELPPKAMIKSVRITRDQFAAENHYAGGISIEIITQPGVGPLRGNVRLLYYDSALNGKNPLVNQKGPEQNKNYGGGLSGSLWKDRASFSLNVSGSSSFTTPVFYGSNANGDIVGGNLDVRTPSTNTSGSGSIDYALTKDQVMRFGLNRFSSRVDNQGAGGFNQAERTFNSENANTSVRLQEVGPIGRRFFLNTRFSASISESSSHSTVEAPTIVINDSRTMGGAQRTGSTRYRNYTLASDLDYVRGRHGVRAGIQIDGTNYRTDQNADYLGTYTFLNEAAFEEGRPRSYTRRIGDPKIQYANVQVGVYLQDDIKVRKNLTLTPGIRYEAQTHLHDYVNVGPRFGITWAPFKSGKTTLRSSWGIFYDWLSTGTYEQTLRQDGFRQQSVNIADPAYPNPGPLTAAPTDRYVLASDLVMPKTMRLSAGVNQQVSTRLNIGMTYAYTRGSNLFVGENLNAPVDGVRPDPTFANVIEAVSTGRSRVHSVGVNGSVNLAKPADRTNTKFLVWARSLQAFASYGTGLAQNDTSGPFSVPATGSLAAEWGPSFEDVRHRVSVGIQTGAVRNLSALIEIDANSGRPFNITSGLDDNGDLIFNDRPDGVGRNSARGAGRWDSYANFNYSIALGKRQLAPGSGVSITSVGGSYSASVVQGPSVARYRLVLGATVQNLFNHANYGGYSGVMTSRLFMQPISVQGVRQVRFNATLTF
jgi:hypothetical protein